MMTDARVEEAYRRYDRAKLALLVTVTVLVLAALGLLLWSSAQARQQRESQLQLAKLLVECTTPPGDRKPPVKVDDPLADCYTRNLARQAEAVGSPPAPINDVVILAAACADRAGVDTEAEIRVCVLEGLR